MHWKHFVVAALVGLAAALLGVWIDAHALLGVYLATSVAVASFAIGAMGILIFTYLVRGSWTEDLHLPLTAAAMTTPVAGLFFIPVLIGVGWLYPWADHAADGAGSFKAVYLTSWFFAARTIAYFVIWTALALWLRRAWSDSRRMVAAGAAGSIVYALTVSIAGVDWLQSLTPEFHSSIYGLLFLTFQLLSGLAFAMAIRLSIPTSPPLNYGAILLSTLLLWAYNHAMQYIIIWSGDIPEEVVWYVHRESGFWGVAFWALILLQFVAPFFALLLQAVRNARRPLLALAVLTVALRFLESYCLALPGIGISGWVLWIAVPGSLLLCIAPCWLVFNLIYARLAASPMDTRPMPAAFDASGNPVTNR
jgi:hypothetical protein